MLVLSRRIGESIVIGSGITVTVMQVRGKSVSLGINAPKEIGVRRSELCGRSQEVESPSLRVLQTTLGLR
ncbi:MAG: carbon storage regulator CsrA [Pirellulales bacterium]